MTPRTPTFWVVADFQLHLHTAVPEHRRRFQMGGRSQVNDAATCDSRQDLVTGKKLSRVFSNAILLQFRHEHSCHPYGHNMRDTTYFAVRDNAAHTVTNRPNATNIDLGQKPTMQGVAHITALRSNNTEAEAL